MPAPAALGVQQYVESICQPLNNEREKIAPVRYGKENARGFSQLSILAVLIVH
jgi:hypothetical protein